MIVDMHIAYPDRDALSSTHPYQTSLSSSASSSSSSVFSLGAVSSQCSVATDASSVSSYTGSDSLDDWRSRCSGRPDLLARRALPPIANCIPATIPVEQRQNPRRSSTSAGQRPPSLVRQCERKVQFVDGLVEAATQMVEVIWPLSVPSTRPDALTGRSILPLRTFIQETLRRSRTSFSTLQVALYYLVLIKSHVPKHDFTMEQPCDVQSVRALQCGRRMFLAALILASKYLQDRNYSARAWSKISGLKVFEINVNEMAFLDAVKWKLHIPQSTFDQWQDLVMRYTPSQPPSPGVSPLSACAQLSEWRAIIPHLTPELNTVDLAVSDPFRLHIPERSRTWPLASPISPLPSPQPRDFIATPRSSTTPSRVNPPRFLEPPTVALPPTPSVPRFAPLPTPQMTPQAVSCTPAVSLAQFSLGSRRSSMQAAIGLANTCSMSRFNNEAFPGRLQSGAFLGGPEMPQRRSSLASSSSSPESMVSDNSLSSRSSRASSISSCVSNPNLRLCRVAAIRSATSCPQKPATGVHVTIKEHDSEHPFHSSGVDDTSSLDGVTPVPMDLPVDAPDFSSFHMGDATRSTADLETAYRRTVYTASPSALTPTRSSTRKRGRSSADLGSLQVNVRSMLRAAADREERRARRESVSPSSTCTSTSTSTRGMSRAYPEIVDDSCLASSFLLSPARCVETPKASSMSSGSSVTLSEMMTPSPLTRSTLSPRSGGWSGQRKRTCTGREPTSYIRLDGSVGLWDEVLRDTGNMIQIR